eukprot:1746011-Pleurochrysis_carterae.AAC.1
MRTHSPLPGEVEPRHCDCCSYGHSASTRAAEHSQLQQQIESLEQAFHTDEIKKHWAAFVRKHKLAHADIGPASGFAPVLNG